MSCHIKATDGDEAGAGEHRRLADGGGGLRSSTHEQILRFNLCQDIIVLEERLMEGLYACLRLAVVNYQRHVNLRKMKACHMLEARHDHMNTTGGNSPVCFAMMSVDGGIVPWMPLARSSEH